LFFTFPKKLRLEPRIPDDLFYVVDTLLGIIVYDVKLTPRSDVASTANDDQGYCGADVAS
jgi:hypothetical protein